jgi:hypothetical protein
MYPIFSTLDFYDICTSDRSTSKANGNPTDTYVCMNICRLQGTDSKDTRNAKMLWQSGLVVLSFFLKSYLLIHALTGFDVTTHSTSLLGAYWSWDRIPPVYSHKLKKADESLCMHFLRTKCDPSVEQTRTIPHEHKKFALGGSANISPQFPRQDATLLQTSAWTLWHGRPNRSA